MGTIIEKRQKLNLNEKIIGHENILLKNLQKSEFNTRSSFVDKNHVDFLANEIKEKGYDLNRALKVNRITDSSNKISAERVVAGMHRYYACIELNFEKVYCLVFLNLTDAEEVYLDQWDNEMDESHKPVHFLEISEHYKYLQDTKKWVVRQIAETINISRSVVGRRIQIAKIPENAKKIIKTTLSVPAWGQIFEEAYFRDICKLCPDHVETICLEIFNTGKKAISNEMDSVGQPIQQMRKLIIQNRVKELLDLQAQNKILKSNGVEESINKISEEYKQPEFNFNFDDIFGEGWDLKPRRLGIGLLKEITRSEKLVFDAIYAKTIGFRKQFDKIALSQFEAMTGLGQKEIREARDKLIDKDLIVCEGSGNDLKTYSLNPVLFEQVWKFIHNLDGGKSKKSRASVGGKPENNGGKKPQTNTNLQNTNTNNNNKDIIDILIKNKIRGTKLDECLSKIEEMGGIEYLNEKVDFIKKYTPKNPDNFNITGLLINAILKDYQSTNKSDLADENDLFSNEQKKELLNLRNQYEMFVDKELDTKLSQLSSTEKEKLKTTLLSKKMENNKLLEKRKDYYNKEYPEELFLGILRDDLKNHFNIEGFDKYCVGKQKSK